MNKRKRGRTFNEKRTEISNITNDSTILSNVAKVKAER